MGLFPGQGIAATLERIGQLREAAVGLVPSGWPDKSVKLLLIAIVQGCLAPNMRNETEKPPWHAREASVSALKTEKPSKTG